MVLEKHEIPLLEFDSDVEAVLMPNHEELDIHLPEKAVFAFLENYIEEYAESHGAKKVAEFVSATKAYPVYVFSYQGHEICMAQAPVGAAAATQFMDWLIAYGVRQIISSGSCGALDDFEENTFLVPYRALRDEGTSYHYMAPSRYVDINKVALEAIEKTLSAKGLLYQEVMAWSTDGFYRETKEKVAYRKSEGCAVVEMECSALAACAQLRQVVWGEILYTADSLADVENYDERDWGTASLEFALEICLDSVVALGE